MDERVIRHYKGALDKINMDPDNRESLLKQYAHVAAEIAATTIEALNTEGIPRRPAIPPQHLPLNSPVLLLARFGGLFYIGTFHSP